MAQIPFMQTITRYLIDARLTGRGDDRVKLPPMGDLAKELGVSRGKVREELIAAQAYGVVEMRPGDGTYVNAFDFHAAIRPAVVYSIACDAESFNHFRKLRAHLEVAFWDEATRALDEADHAQLEQIVERAQRKLESKPIQIPHEEHRELHLHIFSKLGNPFVEGLLKAYWDAYEAVELHLYFDISYYEKMWTSHRALVDALKLNQLRKGKEVLARHFTILESRLQTSD